MGGLFLALLELTFVMVSILLFHSLRRTIGNAAFYLTLGMFFVLGQIVSSSNLMVDPGMAGFRVNLGSTMLLAPYMVAILIVYVLDGTGEAQRMILGFMAILFGYYYLANIIASQCDWTGQSITEAGGRMYLQAVFLHGRRLVVASFLAHLVDLFVLPIIFQSFHNRHCGLFVCVLGTLVLAQVFDSFVFQLVSDPALGVAEWWNQLRETYLARAAVMVWLSILTTVYLRLCDVEPSGKRQPFAIVADFFSGYGKAKQLERYIKEWEGRYHVVVDNSSDLIFIVDPEGTVLNANRAALHTLGLSETESVGFALPEIVRDPTGGTGWLGVWDELSHSPEPEDAAAAHRDWQAVGSDGESVELDVNISRAELNEQPVAVITARDVTERRRLERDRVKLQEELVHSQRMESVGQLAGGIAHDFNNMLHTIRCAVDKLQRLGHGAEGSDAMISNIEEATDRAASLTQQLLGFARKGKYEVRTLDVAEVLERARALFDPVAKKGILLKVIVAPGNLFIKGDATQLQQVFLNMLFNARDAIEEKGQEGKIVLRAEPAADYTPGWPAGAREDESPDRYVCVRIKDDGCGIAPENLPLVYDPFFTTKSVGKGTGMGLAMAYGCISNHQGWIHVESSPGKGTEFFIYLPRT